MEGVMKKLSIDNPFFDFMGKIGDMALLNMLFLLFSLPVVTAGTSFLALYQSCDDMAEGKFISAFRNFTRAWKKNLKIGTKMWILVLLSGCLLIFDLTFVGGMRRDAEGAWGIIAVGIGCLAVLWAIVFCYIFWVMLKGETQIKNIIKQSLYLAVRNFQYTVVMVVVNNIPVVCFLLGGDILAAVVPLYLTLGFGLTAFVNTFFLKKCI